MFKAKKIPGKAIIIGIFAFNLLLLISFTIDLFIQFGFLPESLSILALPIALMSNKFIIVVFLLIIEGVLVGFSWYKISKSSKLKQESSEDDFKFDFLLDEEKSNVNSETIQNHEELTIENENYLDDESIEINFDINPQRVDITYQATPSENVAVLDDDDIDLSPNFLSKNDKLIYTEIKERIDIGKTKDSVTDQQFAIYQTIVNSEWFYCNTLDRDRIGLDNNALNESNITLSDLNLLVKIGLVYRLKISHPTGSFQVLTSNPNIEKKIVETLIRRNCRKRRIKTKQRKVNFPNWKEFGLSKSNWQFNIEIPQFSIVMTFFGDNAFDKNSCNLKHNYKEELKALIATACLKMKADGTAIIITTSKERKESIKQLLKNTGWGNAFILDYSSKDFETKFNNLTK
jgi:hypothetical protein